MKERNGDYSVSHLASYVKRLQWLSLKKEAKAILDLFLNGELPVKQLWTGSGI